MNENKPANTWKIICLLLGSGLVVAAMAFWLRGTFKSDMADPAPAEAKAPSSGPIKLGPEAQRRARLVVAEVAQRPVEKNLVATARVTANQRRTAHIFPLARGIAEQVLVQLGDSVGAGAPLLHYDSIELGELLQELLSARAELERARIEEEVAGSSLSRAEALFQAEAIARKEYVLREAEHRRAVATVRGKEAALVQLERKIRRHGLSEE